MADRDAKGRFLPGHGLLTPPPVYAALSTESRARMASGNDAAKARKGKAASPWARYPACATTRALLSRMRYAKAGKP